MASSNQFAKLLECSICLEELETPKTLACSHDFCKGCVEKILEFQPDGSAWVTCPMRCPERTVITKDQVVNDLPTSITLKNLADALNKDATGMKGPLCRAPCQKVAGFHCCGVLRCESCQKKHENSSQSLLELHDGKAAVSYSNNGLNILCSDHASNCTHLCVDGKLLCVYCVRRNADHMQHSKNGIAAEVRLIKEALNNELNNTLATLKQRENCRRLTEDSIIKIKESFRAIMMQRKELFLNWYKNLLNSEMDTLTQKLDVICAEHLKKYDDITEYYGKKLEQFDALLVLQKEEIMAAINKLRSRAFNRDIISVHGGFDFLSLHPLGDIQMVPGERINLLAEPTSTLECDFENVLTAEMSPDVLGDIAKKVTQNWSSDKQIAHRYSASKMNGIPFSPVSVRDLSIGMKVTVNRSNGRISSGIVRWTGSLPRHTVNYVGIELEHEQGRCDGTFDGVRYFYCQPGKGTIVKFPKVNMAWMEKMIEG